MRRRKKSIAQARRRRREDQLNKINTMRHLAPLLKNP